VTVVEALGLGLTSLVLSWLGALFMTKRGGRGAPVDVPGSRSSHQRPTITGGGIGLALALCLSFLLISVRRYGHLHGELGMLAIATGIVGAVGLWDVYRDPPGHWRLLLELVAAGMILGVGMDIHQVQMPWGQSFNLWWAAAPLTLLWITGMTNLYNFIDGVDGLASVLGIVCASGVAIAAAGKGHPNEALVALVVAFGYLRAGPAVRTAIVAGQFLICVGQLVFVKAVEGSEYVLIHRRPQPGQRAR
jgi:UDP-N-acetylmuramyl pentapeptide phosphotransferase/UDP-N-acetylglucosamine-1-phosphate transferase